MLRKKPGKYRYYCFRIDKWGNKLDRKPGMPHGKDQMDAVKRYVDGNISRRPPIEFSGYVVIHSPLSPAALDSLDGKELQGVDYDFWIYTKDFTAVRPGEYPVYVV